MTLYNLGPYCASLYLFLEVRHALKRIQSELHAPVAGGTEMETVGPVSTLESSKKLLPEDVFLARDIISDFEGFFWDPEDPNTVPVPVPAAWCTPKLEALRDVLLEFHTTNFQAIIFVEQRQVASCLSKVLPAMPELKDKIRSAHLVGQGVNSEGVSKTTDMFHGDAVQAFRRREVNVRAYFGRSFISLVY